MCDTVTLAVRYNSSKVLGRLFWASIRSSDEDGTKVRPRRWFSENTGFNSMLVNEAPKISK